MLQATGGIRNEVNTFLSDYAVPVIAMLLIVWGKGKILPAGFERFLRLRKEILSEF